MSLRRSVPAFVSALVAALAILFAVSFVQADITLTDPGWVLYNGGSNNVTSNSFTLSGGANVLVVEIYNRNGSIDGMPQTPSVNLTYGGSQLQTAAVSYGQAGVYDNSGIYYLYNPPTGVADSLVANFPGSNTDVVIDAFTLGGVNTSAPPLSAAAANPDSSPWVQTLTATGVVAGSWGVDAANLRLGNASYVIGSISGPASLGASLYTSGPSDHNHLFYTPSAGGSILAEGGLAESLNSGSLTWTETCNSGASFNHFNDAMAVFAPAVTSLLAWTGAAGSNGNANWNTTDLNWGGSATYSNTDSVAFPESGINTNITISGTVSPNSVTFTNSSVVYSFSGGPIAGTTSLTVSGGGLVVLNNANAYTGRTNVSSGTLQISQNNALPPATVATFGSGAANGVLNLDGNSQQVGGLIVLGTNAAAQIIGNSSAAANGTFVFAGTSLSSASTFPGTIQDAIGNGTRQTALGVSSGTLTLTGTGNTYSGGTTINAGMLQIGDGATSPGSLPGNVLVNNTAAGALTFNTPAGMSVASSGNISGSGGLTKIGAGTTTLSGNSSYDGQTAVNAGNLAYASLSAASTNSNIVINSPGAVNVSGAYATVAGWLGSGLINQASTGALALTGSSNEAISMAVAGSYSYSTLSLGAVAAGATYSGSLTPAGTVYCLGGGGGPLTYTPAVAGNYGLAVGGVGTLILTASNSYAGATIIANGGTLQFSNAANQTINGNISGGGALATTAGTLTLNGANSYTGGTTVNGGVLSVAVLNNTSSSNIPAGLFTFTGNINVSSGTLQYTGAGGAINLSNTNGMGSGVVQVVNPSADLILSGQIFGGNITKTGPGTLTISGGNESDWQTVLQGTLILAGSNNFPSSGVGVVSGGTLQFATNNVGIWAGVNINGILDFNGTSNGLDGLSGSGTITNNTVSTTSTLYYGADLAGGPSGGTTAFAGAIKDGPGTMALVVTGSGASQGGFGFLTLTGTGNAYSGGTTISGGTLQIGDGATSPGSLPGNVSVGSLSVGGVPALGALIFDTPAGMSVTASGNISGNSSGGLAVIGAGLVTLSGSNTYTGPTTANGGTLQIGNGTSGEYLASPSITLSNNATLEFNHADTYPGGYSGVISGSGQFVKAGSGSLTLNGANTYTGPTTISAGTLVLGGSNLPTTTALNIAAGAALDMGGNSQTVGSLSGLAGAIIANNLVHPSHTYTSSLTVSPTSGATTFAGNIVELDAVEFPRQRGVDDVRQRRIDPHRGEHVLRRDDGQRRHVGDRRGQRVAWQRVGGDQRRGAAGFGKRRGHWRIACGRVADRFGRGCAQRGVGGSGDAHRI